MLKFLLCETITVSFLRCEKLSTDCFDPAGVVHSPWPTMKSCPGTATFLMRFPGLRLSYDPRRRSMACSTMLGSMDRFHDSHLMQLCSRPERHRRAAQTLAVIPFVQRWTMYSPE